MIRFKCEKCGQKFKVDDNCVGKKGKCHKCGSVIVIPATIKIEHLPKKIFVNGESDKKMVALQNNGTSVNCLQPIWDSYTKFESWKRDFRKEGSCFEADTADIVLLIVTNFPQIKFLLYNPVPADGNPDSDDFFDKFPKERVICLHNFNEISVLFEEKRDGSCGFTKSIAESNPQLTSKEIIDEVIRFSKSKFTNSSITMPSNDSDGIETVYSNPLDVDGFREAFHKLTLRPRQSCTKCGERQWHFSALSPNAISAVWVCSFCRKKIICNKNDVENGGS